MTRIASYYLVLLIPTACEIPQRPQLALYWSVSWRQGNQATIALDNLSNHAYRRDSVAELHSVTSAGWHTIVIEQNKALHGTTSPEVGRP